MVLERGLIGLTLLLMAWPALPAKATTKPNPVDPFEERLREVYGEAAAKRPEDPAPPKNGSFEEPKKAASLIAPDGPSREELILAGRKKASYRILFAGYEPGFDIAAAFLDGKQTPSIESLRREWGDRASLRFSVLQAIVESGDSMVRGEIQDEATRKGARALLRLSLLRLRAMGSEQSGLWLASEGEVWIRVLTTLPFDEADHPTLLFAADLRAELWDELLRKVKSGLVPAAEWTERLRGLRPAWPVDRVLLAEARKTLPPVGVQVATTMANELQKDPHRTVAELRGRVRGGAMVKLAALESIWSSANVKSMEREMDQLSEIRLRLGLQRYRQQKTGAPKDLAELQALGFVETIPHCHATGKAWQLTQLGGSAAGKGP